MEKTIYDTPQSKLDNTETKTLSAAERLAQSRKDIEEASAIERLNMVWGLRLFVDLLFCAFALYAIYDAFATRVFEPLAGIIILLVFFGAEIISIMGYFKRLAWCVIPLHIFAGLSMLNFPVGTILSIIHYSNMRKIQFKNAV